MRQQKGDDGGRRRNVKLIGSELLPVGMRIYIYIYLCIPTGRGDRRGAPGALDGVSPGGRGALGARIGGRGDARGACPYDSGGLVETLASQHRPALKARKHETARYLDTGLGGRRDSSK